MLIREGEYLLEGGLGVVAPDGIALVDTQVDVLPEPHESNAAIGRQQPTEGGYSKSGGQRWLTDARRILRTSGLSPACATGHTHRAGG